MMDLPAIRTLWEQRAHEHPGDPAISWNDLPMIHLEINAMLQYLQDGQSILDLGCGSGYSSLACARARRFAQLLGIDYVPTLVAQAHDRLRTATDLLTPRDAIDFRVGDVLAGFDVPSGHFDVVMTTRLLINLASWDNQCQALTHCLRPLRPGGLLLLVEATVQGWQNLNRFLREWRLPEIPMPAYNCFIDTDRLIDHCTRTLGLRLVACTDFSSTYSVATRVLKPLIFRGSQLAAVNDVHEQAPVEPRGADAEWNRWWSAAPSWGDYGKQRLFAFTR